MGRFGALLRILKPPYDVSHEKLGWDGMNFCIFRELYFAECFEFGFLRFGLSQNSDFRLYRDLTAQSGKPDEAPWVISSIFCDGGGSLNRRESARMHLE